MEGQGERVTAFRPIYAIIRGQFKGGPEHGNIAPEQEVRLSISHDKEYATATAIGFGDPFPRFPVEGQAEHPESCWFRDEASAEQIEMADQGLH